MLSQAMIWLFYLVFGASLFFGLVNLLLSNAYDVRQARLRRERARHPQARWLRQRPLISVIVYAQDDADHILSCLQSMLSGSYKKLNITVIDNASHDKTAKLVRQIAKTTSLPTRLVAKRKPSTRQAAIRQATRYAGGGLVLVLDANCNVGTNSIKELVIQHLQTGHQAVLANNQAAHGYTLAGLADSLKSILLGRVKKAGTLVTPGLDSHNYAALYTKEALAGLAKSHPHALSDINLLRKTLAASYVSQAVVHTYGSRKGIKPNLLSNHKLVALLQAARNCLAIMEPLVVGFMIYIALRFNNPGYVTLAWISFSILLLLAVWSDETKGLVAKSRLSLLTPAAYGLYLARLLASYFYTLRRLSRI